MGTYSGFPTNDGIANTRAVGIIVGGLVGGPLVGFGAGMIAGVHRFFVGGLTAPASAIAAVVEGLLAGLFYQRFRLIQIRWPYALALGFILEVLHMAILLLLARPFDRTWKLVEAISPSMLIIAPLGITIFIAILDSVYDEQVRVEGKAARMALQIAEKTLCYLRKGLNEISAYETASTILQNVSNLEAVAVTSTERILAFIGPGADHHLPEVITKSTMEVLKSGKIILAQRRQEIGCPNPKCPLQAKIAVPLIDQEKVVGALAFYKTTPNSITPFEIELISGLAQLISTQIEVSKVEQQSSLRAMAEIRALQFQINPHFLFNAINTIVYYCRKQPETARKLLLNLADFYRNNLSQMEEYVDLETELHHIHAYINIEVARFQGKLNVTYDFPEHCNIKVPPLILQPIVENAVKHGLYPRKNGGSILITGRKSDDCFLVTVKDDGVGIEPEVLSTLLENDSSSKRVGLSNVHRRLQAIYGQVYGVKIESKAGMGTSVTLAFPLERRAIECS